MKKNLIDVVVSINYQFEDKHCKNGIREENVLIDMSLSDLEFHSQCVGFYDKDEYSKFIGREIIATDNIKKLDKASELLKTKIIKDTYCVNEIIGYSLKTLSPKYFANKYKDKFNLIWIKDHLLYYPSCNDKFLDMKFIIDHKQFYNNIKLHNGLVVDFEFDFEPYFREIDVYFDDKHIRTLHKTHIESLNTNIKRFTDKIIEENIVEGKEMFLDFYKNKR